MTGFIRGLFSRKNKQPRAPKPPKQTGAFFLSEDDAKTFGDIDYMRSTKVVRRTFAKKKGQAEELESVRQISALSRRALDEKGLIASQPEKKAEPSSSAQTETSSFQRRNNKTDTSMDMFRNMAKDIKKR
ncbi:hypothetical protein PN498_25660 [Oscillatoria sp. CS-180]|uniref:hypothetical protein n=1 Tax=Oscillatoria sp. CS-180 TaxID=3021720 RepID=UPI0023306111|nr:hypothetical protein [Oscillatoria sp. CS-180]MDB9529404.1 hypothetical protein [Oscillatoria sp. CS-180]